CVFFFFSSRRRHTRSKRDWSSDVCSSDLIAQEQGRFTVADVIRAIHNKMIRRHPHVFGEARARNSAEVLRNWEQIKAEERRTSKEPGKKDSQGEPASLLDGVSRALPATLEGFQLTR